MKKIRLWLFLTVLLGLALGLQLEMTYAQSDAPVYLYFFWGDGCPHCAEAKPFLQTLQQRYPTLKVEAFEVWYNSDNQALYQRMAEAHGFKAQYVPAIFLGEQYWIGYTEAIGQEIERAVAHYVQSGAPDAGAGIIPGHASAPMPTPTPAPGPEATPTPEGGVCLPDTVEDCGPTASHPTLTLPILGTVDLSTTSLTVSTLLISFVDGFNPCSLWVLSVLIALSLHTGSRKKLAIIGLVYITVTALVYVLFIVGLFTMLSLMSLIGWIQAGVSLLALFFAAVNIKDYFWYKEGISFTIDDAKKPGLYKRMRRVLQAGDSLPAMIAATIGLGAGVSLVEFSCTAGFPVVWTNLVAAQQVTPLVFVVLLALYMLIYQIDELGIYLAALITMRATKLEEKHGRILKLFGGTLMLTLALVMLINPRLMNDLGTSLLIFAAAFAIAGLILLVHRNLLPRWGIVIGTEKELLASAVSKKE